MSSVSILRFLVIGLLSLTAFGQSYKPMLDQNAEWQVTYCYFGCLTDVYYTDGDTIVDNKTYKILDGYHYISRTFLLREDVPAKKVYLNIISSGKNEYLLYDYSLAVGDSIDMKNPITPFPENAGYYTVDSIVPNTLNDGLDYKHFYLSPSASNTISTTNAIWIESIGSLSIVTAASGEPNVNGVGKVSCYFKGSNADLIYSQLDSISGCFVQNNLSYLSFKESLNSVVIENSIVTNRCDLRNTENVNAFKIYDLNGRLVQTKKVLNETNLSIEMSDLDRGLYFLELSGVTSKKVFKIVKK